ncbi:MAG: hypothetical protein MI861_25660 [Pirellulales bacterium]|nr:hypothetical protein [Pirellulales bacterium]
MMANEVQPLKIVYGTIGYLLITFPLAYVWHLVAFEQKYAELGYFTREEPIIAFGFGAILLQGILMSVIYPSLCRGKSLLAGALTLALVMGGYHWTAHVLAEAAKHSIAPLPTWFALESLYLAIQFLLGGFWLAFVYRSGSSGPALAE